MKTKRVLIITRHISQQEQAWWARHSVRLQAKPMIESHYLTSKLAPDLPEEIVVFTSKNAVKAVLKSSSAQQLQWLQSKTIAAIQPSTSQYLAEHKLPISCEAPNSAALASKIIDNYPPQSIRYFCKADRLPILPTKLKEANFTVRENIVYQTKAKPQVVDWDEAEGVIFYSPSAVKSFFQLNKWPQEKMAFAIGTTTAKALKAAKVGSIRIAATPSKEGLLAAILSTSNSIYSQT
ncbi:MAG: uroporphyrinogen-III synthase [Bacteroidota bacterium]